MIICRAPFSTLVHGQSLLRPALITQHFAQVKDLYLQMTAGTGHRYLDLPNSFVFEQLDRAKTFFDTPKVTAAYRTLEHAIDPAWIARLLRDALLGDPKVTWYENTVVESANLGDDGRVHVTFRRNTDPSRQAYDHVVNCLWDGRVRIDQSFGLGPPAEWLYRFKLAITLQLVRRHGLFSVGHDSAWPVRRCRQLCQQEQALLVLVSSLHVGDVSASTPSQLVVRPE